MCQSSAAAAARVRALAATKAGAIAFSRTGDRASSERADAALIGASNFFELAVAAAISLGFNSGAALATVVGVLIEVPVMSTVVWIVNPEPGLV